MAVIIIAVGLLYMFGPFIFWNASRAAYSVVRSRHRQEALDQTGWLSDQSEHFVLLYGPADGKLAPVVLENAEEVYGPVTEALGYRPREKVILILHPDRWSLRQAFGWSDREKALGVYWSGVIRLLSPRVWAGDRDPRIVGPVFKKTGPMAHELAHLVLDYRTGGNYPHWFSEGLAQLVEHRLTGFLWIEPGSDHSRKLYTYSELNHSFDQLPNQALAYRQSYLMVDYLERLKGPEGLKELLDLLSEGLGFKAALKRVYGLSTNELERRYLEESIPEATKSGNHGR